MIPYGSLVLIVTPKGKRTIKRLVEGENWQSHDGILTPEIVAAADFGDTVMTSMGRPVQLLDVTLQDLLKGIKRQTQIIYPKDIAYICMKLGAGPGRTICEAGCGSGGLTLALSWFCGPTGRVVSHEAREEFAKLARRNLDWAHVGDNVDINVRDVAEGFCVKNADALFLDVRTPWEYLDKAVEAVRPGAVFGFLLPTVMQVGELLKGLERGPFDHIEVQELLLRDWKPLADRLRPNDRMIAHTSFLVFCRHQKRNHDFDNLRPMGTREMKQKMALEKRLATLD
ncbi:tRNA (adenine-N1)-methyltransferase [Desulfovibrio sp. An276]|uniref:tRNA (adenine-N1)-methyltransferase n=1 Tax=Desulfovibrio sp. An276 TaxID=1965618 RepID=UPI000B36C775|nr:tRNA (adenine-N1)-methyltransferase [Desulfovibrio sp. An276]OUO55390.1 tRNA (adenine-N1)-methyltransferase [Desulfovibrio sp. An276]